LIAYLQKKKVTFQGGSFNVIGFKVFRLNTIINNIKPLQQLLGKFPKTSMDEDYLKSLNLVYIEEKGYWYPHDSSDRMFVKPVFKGKYCIYVSRLIAFLEKPKQHVEEIEDDEDDIEEFIAQDEDMSSSSTTKSGTATTTTTNTTTITTATTTTSSMSGNLESQDWDLLQGAVEETFSIARQMRSAILKDSNIDIPTGIEKVCK